MTLLALQADPTISDVVKYCFRHPWEIFVLRWHWKAALLSGIMRGSIYFFTHITLGWRAALSAFSLEFLFRTINAGITSSVGQVLRLARPKSLVNLIVMVMFPIYGHIVEYTLHTINGDQNVNRSIVITMTFSAVSALFNLFVMRRGAMLVKDKDQQPLLHDLKKMPLIMIEFVSYPFVWVYRRMR